VGVEQLGFIAIAHAFAQAAEAQGGGAER